MTDEPLVSIVIPAYNAAWCVGRAIDSVLAQTWPHLDLIVVNDGSTDRTTDVVAAYGARLTCVDQPNAGMSAARNAGIAAARGEYIAFLDADDRWQPEKLARQMDLMRASDDLAFCSAAARFESPDGDGLGEWSCPPGGSATLADIFRNHAAIAGGASSVLARTALVRELGGFDAALRGAEDTDLWIRLTARGRFACIPEPLVVVLKHPQSVSRNYESMRRGSLTMLRKNRSLLPRELQGAFWRETYAGFLCDYAKWAYRQGETRLAVGDVIAAAATAPLARGRLAASLLLAMATGRRL